MPESITVRCIVCKEYYTTIPPRPRRRLSKCERCGIPSNRQILSKSQGNKCAICGIDASECPLPGNAGERGLVRDHDHLTGKVRGMLCHSCNALLGFAKDDPIRLQNAIEYLIESGKKIVTF
jgi:hypothetical protein